MPPSYNEAPWPSLTPEAMDFVNRLLCKDPRRRMTAAQALSMFSFILSWWFLLNIALLWVFMFFLGDLWIKNYNDIKLSLDILIFWLIKAYICSPSLQKSALRVGTSVFFVLIFFPSIHSCSAAAIPELVPYQLIIFILPKWSLSKFLLSHWNINIFPGKDWKFFRVKGNYAHKWKMTGKIIVSDPMQDQKLTK